MKFMIILSSQVWKLVCGIKAVHWQVVYNFMMLYRGFSQVKCSLSWLSDFWFVGQILAYIFVKVDQYKNKEFSKHRLLFVCKKIFIRHCLSEIVMTTSISSIFTSTHSSRADTIIILDLSKLIHKLRQKPNKIFQYTFTATKIQYVSNFKFSFK